MTGPRVEAVAERAHLELGAAINRHINQARTDRVIPCRINPEGWWPHTNAATSMRMANDAIAQCHTCPVEVECRTFADANGEKDGIWGGQWYGAEEIERTSPCAREGCDGIVPYGKKRYCSQPCQRVADAAINILRQRERREQARRIRQLTKAFQ